MDEVEELIRKLKDKDSDVRWEVAEALTHLAFHDDEVARRIGGPVGLLRHEDPMIRWGAAAALSEIASKRPDYLIPYVEELVRALGDEEAVVRRYTAKALSKIASERPEALIPHVKELLELADKPLAEKVREALLSLIREGSPEIVRYMDSLPQDLRVEAVKSLPAKLGPNEFDKLVELAKAYPGMLKEDGGLVSLALWVVDGKAREVREDVVEEAVRAMLSSGNELSLKLAEIRPDLVIKHLEVAPEGMREELLEKVSEVAPELLKQVTSLRGKPLMRLLLATQARGKGPLIVESLFSDDPEERELASKAFLKLVEESPEEAAKLLPILEAVELNEHLRKALAELSRDYGDQVLRIALKDEELLSMLESVNDASPLIEAPSPAAMKLLKRLADERPELLVEHVDRIRELLKDPSLRRDAAYLLARIELVGPARQVEGQAQATEGRESRSTQPITLLVNPKPLKVEPASGQYGNYLVEGLIGEGGYSKVYLAKHAFLGKKVALKVFKRNPAFDRELNSLRQLEHPHILKVLDAGVQGDERYLVLELGESTLAEVEPPLPDDQLEKLLLALASALKYAHSLNLVHADVKPSNVILVRAGEGYVPKLADFSIAKFWLEDSTVSMTVKGTMGFLDPFLVSKLERGAPSFQDYVLADIYSLGVTLSLYMAPDSRLRDLILKMASPIPHLRPSLDEVISHKNY